MFLEQFRMTLKKNARISCDELLPIILIPLLSIIATINLYSFIVICTGLPISMYIAHKFIQNSVPRTKIYVVWNIVTIIYLYLLFEFTLPLSEILPIENIAFIILLTITIYCFIKTKLRASENFVTQTNSENDDVQDIIEDQITLLINDSNENVDESTKHISQSNICSQCKKYMPTRTYHCMHCSSCILEKHYHCFWLNCCIGKFNHQYFLFGCIMGLSTLLFASNLALTAICHPFLIFTLFNIDVLLPDDCNDVFEQFDVALCFVGSVYAIIYALCILITLLQQLYLISKGVSLTEWQIGLRNNRLGWRINYKQFILNCFKR